MWEGFDSDQSLLRAVRWSREMLDVSTAVQLPLCLSFICVSSLVAHALVPRQQRINRVDEPKSAHFAILRHGRSLGRDHREVDTKTSRKMAIDWK